MQTENLALRESIPTFRRVKPAIARSFRAAAIPILSPGIVGIPELMQEHRDWTCAEGLHGDLHPVGVDVPRSGGRCYGTVQPHKETSATKAQRAGRDSDLKASIPPSVAPCARATSQALPAAPGSSGTMISQAGPVARASFRSSVTTGQSRASANARYQAS